MVRIEVGLHDPATTQGGGGEQLVQGGVLRVGHAVFHRFEQVAQRCGPPGEFDRVLGGRRLQQVHLAFGEGFRGHSVGQVREEPNDHLGVGDTDRPGVHRGGGVRPFDEGFAEVHDLRGRTRSDARHPGQPRCRRTRTQGFRRAPGFQVRDQAHPQRLQVTDALAHRTRRRHQLGLDQTPRFNPARVSEHNVQVHKSNTSTNQCARRASVFEHFSVTRCESACRAKRGQLCTNTIRTVDAVPQHLLVRRGESASENASATAQRRPRAGFHYKRHQLKLAGGVDVRVTVLLALAYVAFVAFDFIQTPVARVLALVVGAVVPSSTLR